MILANQTAYPPRIADKVIRSGSITRNIADRWMLGWPDLVQSMFENGSYLAQLSAQADREKDVLADAGDMPNLSVHEILRLHEVPAHPPLVDSH